MAITLNPEVRKAAIEMALHNREAEPALQEIYLFPAEEEIRLICIDPTTSPSKDKHFVRPFYFGRSIQSGILYRSGIALILPEERETLSPPEGWGTWDDAEMLSEGR